MMTMRINYCSGASISYHSKLLFIGQKFHCSVFKDRAGGKLGDANWAIQVGDEVMGLVNHFTKGGVGCIMWNSLLVSSIILWKLILSYIHKENCGAHYIIALLMGERGIIDFTMVIT